MNEPADKPKITLLDDFLEAEGVIHVLRQRISNLEQFRALHLSPQQMDQAAQLETNNGTDDSAQTIAGLEKQLAELTGCQAILESELDRLTQENDDLRNASGSNSQEAASSTAPPSDQTMALEKQLAELTGCQAILESELDRLTEENDALRSNSSPAQSGTIAPESEPQEQAKQIETLEKKVEELNGCQTILESELDRLTEENNTLRSNAPPIANDDDDDDDSESTESFDDEIRKQAINEVDAEQELAALRDEAVHATELAFSAMRANADLGGIIHLLTHSFACKNTAELGRLVMQTLGNSNLEGVVAFSYGKSKEYIGLQKPVSDEHKKLIASIPKDVPMTQTQTHLMFYNEYCQFLIWGFDTSDERAFDELKDTLTMMTTGVSAGARRIISEYTATKERANFEKLVATTAKNMNQIEQQHQQEITQVQQMSTNLLASLKAQLETQGAAQDSKDTVVSLVSKELVNIEEMIKSAATVDQNFLAVINSLGSALKK